VKVDRTAKIPLPNYDPVPIPPASYAVDELLGMMRDGQVRYGSSVTGDQDLGTGWVGGKDATAYDRDTVYVRATNRHDHSTTARVPIAPHVAMMIDAVVARSPELGSKSDFIRDSIIHSLWRWREIMGEEMDVDWHNTLTLDVLRATQERMKAEVRERAEFVDAAHDALSAIRDSGDVGRLGEAVEFHAQIAEQLPEPYRGKLLDIVGRFR